jgi:hypothetical protein
MDMKYVVATMIMVIPTWRSVLQFSSGGVIFEKKLLSMTSRVTKHSMGNVSKIVILKLIRDTFIRSSFQQ